MISTIAAAVLLLAAPAAVAPPASAAAAKKTDLTVSYLAEAGYAAAVKLRCDPAGGAHPKKVKACRSLAAVGGDPSRLTPAPMMCTMEYAPVTAQVKGTWRGRPVNWSHKFGNRCDMHRTTGVLTAF
ncbi:SSI family serine proteinase inhibitor [Actinoplanes sp. NPDC048967]|uniref:SSI family serine proteinase inhibitor n=1 Tax=Actinoplanes sp. NPDC048967 TaxID=3155269 RepID=UPI0033F0113B